VIEVEAINPLVVGLLRGCRRDGSFLPGMSAVRRVAGTGHEDAIDRNRSTAVLRVRTLQTGCGRWSTASRATASVLLAVLSVPCWLACWTCLRRC